MQKTRDSLIEWNNTFPFDRLYRQKYKIGFGSPEHRELCQIDIYFDVLEDRLFDEYIDEQRELMKMKEDYTAGKLIRDNAKTAVDEKLEDIFDAMKVTEFNQEEDE